MSGLRFEIEEVAELRIDGPAALADHALLSPFIWRDGEERRLLIRAIAPAVRPADAWGSAAARTGSASG